MLVYEVQIQTEPEIREEYRSWLRKHVAEMLRIPGFTGARILEWPEGLFQTQYLMLNQQALDHYLQHHAPRMRGDGEKRFGGRFSAQRRVTTEVFDATPANLDKDEEYSEVRSQRTTSFNKGAGSMNTSINWAKIRGELNKLADVEKLKSEFGKISQEIRRFDVHVMLSPTAQQRLSKIEKRYTQTVQAVTKAQRELDREFNRVVRALKDHKMTTQQKIELIKKVAMEQKSKLKKASTKLKTRGAKKTAKRRTTKKTANA